MLMSCFKLLLELAQFVEVLMREKGRAAARGVQRHVAAHHGILELPYGALRIAQNLLALV